MMVHVRRGWGNTERNAPRIPIAAMVTVTIFIGNISVFPQEPMCSALKMKGKVDVGKVDVVTNQAVNLWVSLEGAMTIWIAALKTV